MYFCRDLIRRKDSFHTSPALNQPVAPDRDRTRTVSMDAQTQDALLQINRRFYERTAVQFDATRQGWTPGLRAILPYFERGEKDWPTVLDVGCGNGRFARLLACESLRARYVGVDGNAQLLQLARSAAAGLDGVECLFLQADLASPSWLAALTDASARDGCWPAPIEEEGRAPFDVVLCTATIQHLPAYGLRLRLLGDFQRLTDGYIILSFWQFLGRERFRAKLIDPRTVGIDPGALEAGDGLLPWKQGVEAIRYVHQVDDVELEHLAADAGLDIVHTFRADGKRKDADSSGVLPGLNLYAVLR